MKKILKILECARISDIFKAVCEAISEYQADNWYDLICALKKHSCLPCWTCIAHTGDSGSRESSQETGAIVQ